MFCENCGEKINGNVNFCRSCGEKVSRDISSYQYPERLPQGYKYEEGQFGTTMIVEIGSACDRPPHC